MPPVSYPFPENVEKRLQKVLFSVNTEIKSAVLIHSLDRNYKTGGELRQSLFELLGESVWLPSHKSFSDYCHEVFYPNGLVVEKPILKYQYPKRYAEPGLHWRISPAGKKYAKPLAAFSLKYAVDNNKSMYEYLGMTASRGKSRAPYNRFRIIELVGDGYSREIDLAKTINLCQAGVRDTLLILRHTGFIEFTSVSEKKGQFKYRWVSGKNPEDVETVCKRKNLTLTVARKLSELGEADYNHLAKELEYSNPKHISVVLSGLVRQGTAQRIGPFKSGEIQSQISLTEEGKKLKENYCNPVRNALKDGKELEEMYEILCKLKEPGMLNYTERGIELYFFVSPALKREHPRDREDQLLKFVEQFHENHRRWPRRRDIISFSSLFETYLKPLVDKGILTKRRRKKAVRYTIPINTLN
jgi:DNA-binding HxlR family transcriptional regulator